MTSVTSFPERSVNITVILGENWKKSSLVKIEKSQHSSDLPSLKYINPMLFLSHISQILAHNLKIFSFIEMNWDTESETFDTVVFDRNDWCSFRVYNNVLAFLEQTLEQTINNWRVWQFKLVNWSKWDSEETLAKSKIIIKHWVWKITVSPLYIGQFNLPFVVHFQVKGWCLSRCQGGDISRFIWLSMSFGT